MIVIKVNAAVDCRGLGTGQARRGLSCDVGLRQGQSLRATWLAASCLCLDAYCSLHWLTCQVETFLFCTPSPPRLTVLYCTHGHVRVCRAASST